MNKGALPGIGRDGQGTRLLRFDLDDGTGTALATGAKARYQSVPYDLTVVGWRLMADLSGSLVLDVWADRAANFPPTVADTLISAGAKPTLTSAVFAEAVELSGWRGELEAGDVLELSVDSVTTVVRAVLELTVLPR